MLHFLQRFSLLLMSGSVFLMGCATPTTPPADIEPKATQVALKNPKFDTVVNGTLVDWSASEHNAGKSYTFKSDEKDAFSPPFSAQIARYGPEIYGLLEQSIIIKPEWIGKKARLSAYLKTTGAVDEGGGLVLQARRGDGSINTHDHMNETRLRNDSPWKRYSVSVAIPTGTYWLRVGAMLEGSGTLWVDDFQLEIVD
jgi:hypothetical protein